jgi:TIR domain
MADVFISYSRRDTEFVRSLHARLARSERDAWVDWEDIPPSAEWMAEIERAIEAADTFVFVISPDSVVSLTCEHECAHAAACNKRIVPVVAREVDTQSAPERIRKLNWLFFRPSDDLEAAYNQLIEIIDTDLAWVRAHSRLLVRAAAPRKSILVRAAAPRKSKGVAGQRERPELPVGRHGFGRLGALGGASLSTSAEAG